MNDRYEQAHKVSSLGIIGNVFLFIIKITVGFTSRSQAMLADALNSGTDVLSSVMTFIGNKIASKGADEDHHLGHGKAEYIYSMLISITMLYLGVRTLISSFMTFFKPSEYNFTIWLVVVCFINIIVKICLYLYAKNIAKKYNNLLLRANADDHRNDCFITSFTLISSCFSLFNIKLFDSIVGVGIALWITYTGLSIFKESYDVLMDKAISTETKDKVMSIINGHKEIARVNHFNATPVGYQYHISFTIFVDGNLSTFESHTIANTLEREIEAQVPEIYLSVIHVNPIELNDDSQK